ncbi:SDR family oxidoreductase [Limibaculum sp. M0105]|uniref:SDR family oxidoreductase n=1 Tax=Thermohalobaculum xanthum TaxID=2753746 RepID=A0A8J7M7G0_9RHOB|nr:SDR family NAD(P)-dependent oxidoreductase [Thermohalobaculum xanthum]MBK0399696.1 SDR family oxidoreductase [Thermohalobaculum xanthum]
MSLAGKVILVTGASSGLGAHMATFLAARGARVWAAARRVEALEALCASADGSMQAVSMDVADPASVSAAVGHVTEAEGGLDGLVNNAGIAWGGRALDMPDDEWHRVIDTNLTGAFTVAREAARAMVPGGGGAIVSTASILGFGTGAGVAAYAASKAAVVHLTRCLALEWARHGIRVNALAPGYIPTEINRNYLESEAGEEMKQTIPLRRFGTPQDLDGPLELLLSDAGGYITGVTLPVDGGHLVRPL